MYKALKDFDSLVAGKEYTQEQLLAFYHESTITSLINAGVLEEIKAIKETKKA